jgi:hypothetical protein
VSLYDHTFKWGLNYKFDSYWGKADQERTAMPVTSDKKGALSPARRRKR